jgi:hypothetical protein
MSQKIQENVHDDSDDDYPCDDIFFLRHQTPEIKAKSMIKIPIIIKTANKVEREFFFIMITEVLFVLSF